MTPAGGWLLAPLVLLVLCLGLGLLAERAAGTRLPGFALPGLGLAALVVVAGLLTIADATAELAPPACAVLAVAGLVVGRPWRDARFRSGAPAVAVLALAFASFAAPSVLSGQASVTGYIKLDDSAIWLGLIAHLMEHGRDIAMVPHSTFQLDLVDWLANGYPVGAFTPIGVTARLSGQDYANVYQPAIAVYGAVTALGLYGCVRSLVDGPWRAAVAAVVGVQASLFYGYAQWGSVKEIAAAALIATVAGLAGRGPRAILLAALPAAALLDTYGAGGIVWAFPAMALVVVVAALAAPLLRVAATAAGAVAVVAVGSIPAIVVLHTDVQATTNGSPSNQEDIGKLFAPLKLLQGAGLWPAGDFRTPPDPRWPATLLAVLGLVLAAGAVALAVRRRCWALPALVATVVAAAAVGLHKGGPWIDAKVLAITAPFLLGAAAALPLTAARRLAIPAGALLVLAALWSSALAARDVYVAPRAELSELRSLGDQLAGKGPTLVLNYEGYATRYFLGPAEDEGISDLRYNQIPSRSGDTFPDFTTAEVDDVDQAALFSYPAVVRRVSPVGSRPPSGYRSVHAGRYFEAWRRAGALPKQHISLGTPLQPGAALPCGQVREAARHASTLVAAPIVNPVLADLATAKLPADWKGDVVRPRSDGRATVTLLLSQAGVWRTWVGGGTLGRLRVTVDGHDVGSYHHQLDASVGWLRFDARRLAAGAHTIVLDYARGWRPGRGDDAGQLPLGPVALSLERQPAVRRVPAADARSLCDGGTYDWLETFG